MGFDLMDNFALKCCVCFVDIVLAIEMFDSVVIELFVAVLVDLFGDVGNDVIASDNCCYGIVDWFIWYFCCEVLPLQQNQHIPWSNKINNANKISKAY